MHTDNDILECLEHIRNLNSNIVDLAHMVRTSSVDCVSEIDAVSYLRSQLDPKNYIPAAGNWSASYRTLAFIAGEILEAPMQTTALEFGSGVSTVWIALALKKYGSGRLISIEHDATYLRRTAEILARNNLVEIVDLRHAPLVEKDKAIWYDCDVVTHELPDLDLVFVDGPPGRSATLARKPAFDVLCPYLRDGALVLLDDCDRSDERLIVDQWTEKTLVDHELRRVGEVSRTALLRFLRTKIEVE